MEGEGCVRKQVYRVGGRERKRKEGTGRETKRRNKVLKGVDREGRGKKQGP